MRLHIDLIPVAKEIFWGIIPRECLRYLACNPFCRRIPCDVDPNSTTCPIQDAMAPCTAA